MNIRKSKQILITIAVILMAGFCLPQSFGLAQQLAPSSTTYRLDDSQVDFGGGNSTSSGYRSVDTMSGEDSAAGTSSTYKLSPGLAPQAYPGVPGQPTLTNTGGALYNSLDFAVATGGNKSDAVYAVAISPDNFTTTYFIQTDDTVATTTAWQNYAAWGSGAGERVTGLSASTTYQIKVKARFGAGSESGYSLAASAATVAPQFTMTISGVSSGTVVAGATSTITTTANGISFGNLVPGTVAVAIQQITVTTNAAAGYTTTVQENNDLTNSHGQTIAPVSGTNAAPAGFPSSVSAGAFGYHTTDASLCTGTATRFSPSDTYAAAAASPLEIACNQLPVSNDSTYVVYKALIGALQASGSYTNTITYISTGKY
jgi:hypothetical protein